MHTISQLLKRERFLDYFMTYIFCPFSADGTLNFELPCSYVQIPEDREQIAEYCSFMAERRMLRMLQKKKKIKNPGCISEGCRICFYLYTTAKENAV